MTTQGDGRVWICPTCKDRVADGWGGRRCAHDAAGYVPLDVWNKRRDRNLGRVIDEKYVVYDLLGSGGFGTVYRAAQPRLDRDVAIKVMKVGEEQAEAERQRERFNREARVLAGIDSPAIVKLFDFGEDDGLLYMVMELVSGRPLVSILAEAGHLPASRAVDLVAQTLRAIATPHREGLVHRDLKPANVMVSRDHEGRERVKLIDFGIANREATDDGETILTLAKLPIGTPRYMAPEQFAENALVTAAADLYAISVMLFEALTGNTPLSNDVMSIVRFHASGQPPPWLPAELRLPAVDAVVRRGLAPRVEDRYASALEMLKELEAAIVSDRAAQGRPSHGGAAMRFAVVIVLAALIGVLAAWFVVSEPADKPAARAESGGTVTSVQAPQDQAAPVRPQDAAVESEAPPPVDAGPQSDVAPPPVDAARPPPPAPPASVPTRRPPTLSARDRQLGRQVCQHLGGCKCAQAHETIAKIGSVSLKARLGKLRCELPIVGLECKPPKGLLASCRGL